jgi:hypothetical protein
MISSTIFYSSRYHDPPIQYIQKWEITLLS